MNGSERKEEYEDGFQERTGVPCEDAGLMMGKKSDRNVATPYSAATGCLASTSSAFWSRSQARRDIFTRPFSSTPRHSAVMTSPFFDDVFNVFGAPFGEFGNVDESVFTREHFHERAELGDGNDLAGVNLAHFDFLEHGGLSPPWRDRGLPASKHH